MKKIGFVGCGNMGSAMVQGALHAGWAKPEEILVRDDSDDSLGRLTEKCHVLPCPSNLELARSAEIVVLAVKPIAYPQVLEEIRPALRSESIVLAIAPAFSIRKIRELSDSERLKVCRAMPNTPAMIGCGVTGVCFSDTVLPEERETLLGFFNSFGTGIPVTEAQLKAVCSISGSSPAFIYMMIEALAQGGIRLGLGAASAYRFAAAAVEGSARMVKETGKHPAELRDAVCSAGGTTIEGVACLEQAGFKGTLIEAMNCSAERFQTMQDEADAI